MLTDVLSFFQTNTMIIGIDVYHEKNLCSPSVVGFVASMDKTFTNWFSLAIIQNNTYEEILCSFQTTINKALTKYKEVCFYNFFIVLSILNFNFNIIF